MSTRILTGALIAGLLAGLVAAALQIATLVPLILQAETYEAAGAGHDGDDAGDDAIAAAVPEAPVEAAGASLWRHFGTLATALVAYAGFGLVLGAGMALAARAGHPPSARAGLLWGLGGFLALHLAPAAGLAINMPGAVTAPLGARQVWWAFCATATAAGLLAVAFGRGWPWALGGIVLIALPQVVGAPMPPEPGGLVPPGLASEFATRSLGVAAVGWAALGSLAGALAARPGRVPASLARPA